MMRKRMEAPKPMNEMKTVTKEYGNRKGPMTWGNHIKHFYKASKAYGLSHGDTMRHVGTVYRSNKYK